MRRLLALLMLPLLCLLAPLAQAANPALISFTNCPSGYPPASCAIGDTTFAANDVIVVGVFSGNGTLGTVTATDSKYSTSYSAPSTSSETNGSMAVYLRYFVVPTMYSGTVTVSVGMTTTQYSGFYIWHFGPYTNPTVDTGANTAAMGSSTSFVADVSTTAAYEPLVLMAQNSGTACASSSTGTWTNDGGGSVNAMGYHAINSGTGANNFTCTLSASTAWAAVTFGIYNAGSGGSCTNYFWSNSGNWIVPNGGSGSFWALNNGSFATPSCAAGTNYWLKTGAKGYQ